MKKLIVSLLLLMSIILSMSVPCYASGNKISWSEDEIIFMEEHPIIKLGVDPGFVPFEFIDKGGEYKGIAADYLSLISEKTGMKFEAVKGVTWPKAYDMALAGEVDALPAVGKTAERELHFLYSEPYYYFKRGIITRDSNTSISGIEDLNGMTVAVQRNSSHHSYLLSYPKINLCLYDSVEAAITAVVTGSETAFVGNLTTTNYLIRSNGLTNLKLISFEAEKEQALHFAIRKDWPELVSIINKALNSITENEKIVINKKWIDLEQNIDYGPIIRIIIIIGALVLVIMVVSFYWIIRLRKEVKKRKIVQVELEKAKHEAEDANEFKSSFLARMSHEIRTPLNAITGMAYLLKKTNLTLTQKMYTDRITQASSNMLSIINDILDYSKIEAGKVELEITSFSMDQAIQDVVNIISYKIEEQEIGFKLSKDPLIPNWFFGDLKRIEQILLNLLNNAAKFTNSGEVSLYIRLLAKENEKYHISFTVKDTGIGMNEEQVQKLFLPFTQGDISISRRFGGSGLGLSIVKNLIDMMGGQIQVFSTVGDGSTFIVHLSLVIDKEKEDAYVNTLSTGQFKNVRTLILEKTGASMNLIGSYLGAFGMQCELTSSQASALSMLEAADGKFAKPFDLLIVDYETPREGGFNFIESIRNNKRIVKRPKVIMLLPMMREDLFDKLGEYEIDIGIGKPIIPSILFNGILDIFRLKAVSTARPTVSNEVSTAKFSKVHCVLIAEDNKTNQLIAESLLQQIGIESILASDGKVAIELYNLHKNKIDLILMDLHMPIMNGYEAAQEIRKLSDRIPIVAMTADVIMGVKEKCEQSGIHHYISKPFDPDYFIKTIKDILLNNKEINTQVFEILDLAVGLKNIGGDKEIYHQILNEYFNENQDTLEKISQKISEKRYADASQIVHKVKSSSGSIGANKMYALAIKLQKALDEGNEDDIQRLTMKFTYVIRKLLEEIAKLLN